MGQSVSECKPTCTLSDPVTNTVKVDPTLLTGSPVGGLKAQLPAQEEADSKLKEEEEWQQAEELRRCEEAQPEKERLQAEEEERLRLQADEELRHREAEEEAARKQAEEAQRQAEVEAQRRREDAELAERLAREEREQVAAAERAKAEAARAAIAKAKAEVEAAQKAVDDFLKARGFKNMLTPRKAVCGAAVYPLHLAVEENNADTVRALLRCGVDKVQKNAAKKTALELAEKFNKNGSHSAIVELLKAAA